MPNQSVKVIESKMIYEGPVFGVRRDRVLEPGNVEVTREIVTHSGSVVLLPVFRDKNILLVRQYRHPLGEYLWELVAGRIEPNERPLAAAQRELLEETGYSAGRFRKLLEVIPSPGYLTERMTIYLCEKLTAGTAQPEEDEKIVAKHFTLRELERMIRRGRLRDAKSIAGILYYARFWHKKR